MNQSWWFWGVFVSGLVIDIIYQGLVFTTIELEFRNKPAEKSLTKKIIDEWLGFIASNAATGPIAAVSYDSWFRAQNPI